VAFKILRFDENTDQLEYTEEVVPKCAYIMSNSTHWQIYPSTHWHLDQLSRKHIGWNQWNKNVWAHSSAIIILYR